MWPRRPLEILNLCAVGLLLALALFCAAKTGQPAEWLGLIARLVVTAIGVGIMARLARGEAAKSPVMQIIVNFYPLLLVPVIFDSMSRIIPEVNPFQGDALLIAIDRALLGGDPTVWLERFVRPWLNDVFFTSYCFFYLLPVAVGVPLWVKDKALAKRFTFALVLAFYVSYVGYFLVPAKGPYLSGLDALQTISHEQLVATPIAGSIFRTLATLEKTKHDVFPSGHALIAAMCMIAAVRYLRWWSLPILAAGTMLILSTVYCRYHYFIDVLTGLALAGVLWPGGAWGYRKMGGEKLEVENEK